MNVLELGPGTRPHPQTTWGIDLHHPINLPPMSACDWTDSVWAPGTRYRTRWPIDAGSVDAVYSSHFMEHVAKGDDLLWVMNEAWRVLRPGGSFTVVLPTIGYTDVERGVSVPYHGWQPWADPTHVSYWWLPEAFLYFCEGPFKPNADYGIKIWAQLGDRIESYAVDAYLADLAMPSPSFWAIRGGWEGVVRIFKS